MEPAFIMMRTSSMSGLAVSASSVCSTMALPAMRMSCLGMPSPTRTPTPPASTTATVRDDAVVMELLGVQRAGR